VALTALTFQNDSELLGAEHFSAATLSAQVLSIIRQHPVSAVKTGMLPTRELVVEAARLFRETSLPAPVIDPVMRASSGYALVQDDAIEALVEELLPLARLITPNLPEAEFLTGLRIVDEAGMRRAAAALRARGAGAVLIKGGHLEAEQTGSEENTTREAIDVLDDGGSVTTFRAAWIDVRTFVVQVACFPQPLRPASPEATAWSIPLAKRNDSFTNQSRAHKVPRFSRVVGRDLVRAEEQECLKYPFGQSLSPPLSKAIIYLAHLSLVCTRTVALPRRGYASKPRVAASATLEN